MTQQRRPKGYVGLNHETIGSDILAFLGAVHSPELVLGKEAAAKLRAVKPDGWYPISMLLDMLEALDQRLGAAGLRSMGWNIFKNSHAEAAKASAKSARDIILNFDAMYRRANRGHLIGGWTVKKLEPGHAEMEKTTPHHCGVEEGIVEEALRTMGVPAQIRQTKCFRRGDDACLFVIDSKVTDGRWG